MMKDAPENSYLTISLLAHVLLLLAFIISVRFSSSIPVLENTNKNDVISAVVLGDIKTSKIIPQKLSSPPAPIKKPEEVIKKPEPVKVVAKPQVKPEPPKQKVIALEKPKPQKKVEDDLAKDFLEDMKKQTAKAKKKKPAVADVMKQKLKKHDELASTFEKELQQQAEKTMRQQLLEEDIRLKGERVRQAQGIVDKYKALIIQAISQNWIIPTQANKKLSSELMIRLSPGGTVLDVQVTRSSGDPALDSSARAAVLKASPLPVPKDPQAFQAFKQFVLKVKPEIILGAG